MRIFALSLFLLFSLQCKEKEIEVQECDAVGNAYGSGKHYIDRTLVKVDENGMEDYSTIDTKKLLERSKKESSNCFPGKKDSL